MNKHLLTVLSLTTFAGMQVVNAQQISVAGKITDNAGTPISGVTIVVKGTSKATTTNQNGLFSINTDHNSILSISAVGYISQDINVAGRKTLSVALTSSSEDIDEVMVVAYGTAKKVHTQDQLPILITLKKRKMFLLHHFRML